MVYNAQQLYRQSQFTTASPAELTLHLYNGALRFLNQAKQAIAERQTEIANERLERVQAVVRELMVTLDMTVDIARQLAPLYDYMLHRLTEANVKKDAAIVDEVAGLITELRDAWKEVVKWSRSQASAEVGR